MTRARQGKIARLPHHLREEVNRRLSDGQTAATILDWLNSQEETIAILEQYFSGIPISPQNLSEWRGGGFLDWRATQEREANIRALADYSYRLAEAGGKDLSAGAVAIAAGKIYEVLENVVSYDADDGTEEGAAEAGIIDALIKLRNVELNARRVDQRDEVLALAQRKQESKEREIALAEAKFEVLAVETFIKWAESKDARKILGSGQAKHVQMSQLRELMFGPIEGS